MMKAGFVTSRPKPGHFGEEFKIGELPRPTEASLTKGQILVQVKAVGVNIDDINVTQGSFLGGMPFLQSRVPSKEKPDIVGSDFSGIVTAVGPGVSSVKPGDNVLGFQQKPIKHHEGPWSEYTVVNDGSYVAFSRENLSFIDAAALVMPIFVASDMVKISEIEKESSSRCLVLGASGGIGTMLVKILKNMGKKVHITGVCGPSNKELVLQVGADEVFDYTKKSLSEQLSDSGSEKFDIVFDLVGGTDYEDEAFKHLLKPKVGKYVTATGPVKFIGDRMLTFSEKLSYVFGILWRMSRTSLLPTNKPRYLLAGPQDIDIDTFSKLIKQGVRAQIGKVIPFERDAILEAVTVAQSHRAKGRTVIEF